MKSTSKKQIWLAALLACGAACAPSMPSTAYQASRAAALPRAQCSDTPPAERAKRLLSLPGLLEVRALTTDVRGSKTFHGARLEGAMLRFAAPPAVTSSWLLREIECHQADVALGRTLAPDDDPYVLPGDWLEVAVDPEGSTFVVTTRGRGDAAIEAALERARHFRDHASPDGS